MPQTPIATKIHQPFDIHRGLASQIAFDEVVAIDHFADLQNLLIRKLRHPPLVRNSYFSHDLPGLGRTNAVNVLEPDQDPLVGRNVNTSYTGQGRHSCCRLAAGRSISRYPSATRRLSSPAFPL